MFLLKSNLLPWKHFSLRSKQGMGRKEQEACNWISKREKHLCKGDEKAGWPDMVRAWGGGGAGRGCSLRGARQLERWARTKSLLHPNESGRCAGRKGLQTFTDDTQVSLHDRGNCVRQGLASMGEEERETRTWGPGEMTWPGRTEAFYRSWVTSHHNSDLVTTPVMEPNSSVACGTFPKSRVW